MKNNMSKTIDCDINYVYEDQNKHDINTNNGWICPKCGRAINPNYKVCPYCSTQYTEETLNPGESIICD